MDDFVLELIEDFIAECTDLIEEIEPSLLSSDSMNKDLANSLFRPIHSLKGTSASLGFKNIASAVHEVENLLSFFQQKEYDADTEKYRNFFLTFFDYTRHSFAILNREKSDELCFDESQKIIKEAKQLVELLESGFDEFKGKVQIDLEEDTEDVDDQDRIEIDQEMIDSFIAESRDIFNSIEEGLLEMSKNAGNTDPLGEAFRNIHSFKGNCGIFSLGGLEKLSHKIETVLDFVLSDELKSESSIYNAIIPMLDVLRSGAESITVDSKGDVEGLDLYLEILDGILSNRVLHEKKIDKFKIDETEFDSPFAEASLSIKRQDIRVDIAKLDILHNLVGELVTVKTMIYDHFKDIKDKDRANKTFRLFNRVAIDLQDISMSIRMIPIAGLFKKMIRIVHDISCKSNKKVNFNYIGEDTEIDKTVIEKIGDPLVHMIRNAVDHGIEPPDVRRDIGKEPKGNVTLTARNDAAEIWIIITDDGKGLNKEAILQKGISQGLVDGDGEGLTDREIYSLIFMPGFSTAAVVTDISGRGVGMDVVKTNIEEIKGKIDIDSIPGLGTTFTIRIPLTLAVIQGMLLEVGKNRYTLPMEVIKESVRVTVDQTTIPLGDQELVKVRGQMIPVLRLSELHQIETEIERIEDGILVIVESREMSIAIMVDRLIGQYETVVKPLPAYFEQVKGVSGCSIMGNGDASLILDVGTLVDLSREKTKRLTEEKQANDRFEIAIDNR